MQTQHVVVPLESDESDVPLMGTLESKFNRETEPKQGIQFPKLKQGKKNKQELPPQNFHSDLKKKKKKKKKKKVPELVVHEPIPQTPSASAKKKVSFSPRVVSTVAYTYSKQEYDRTPIMGIFNHFCNCCMEGIEGARFHCQLCENFDMCQSCFVSQGAQHCHGQQSFSCPELDELEEEDEGDEGDYDLLNEYLASLSAQGDEGEEDTSLDGLSFRFVDEDNDGGTEPSSVRLADENGPLERISPHEAASLEKEDENTPIRMLFPKNAAVTPAAAKPKRVRKKKQTPPASVLPKPTEQHAEKKTEDAPHQAKKEKKKKSEPLTSPPKQLPTTAEPPQRENGALKRPKPKKRKQSNGTKGSRPLAAEGEDDPVLLQKFSAPAASPKKNPQNEITKKMTKPQTTPLATAPDSKKRARAAAPSSKVKKQKLTTSPASSLEFSFA